jgi:hypothetical protein
MSNLKTVFANLEIRAFEDDDGNHTVLSNSEPAFCFIRRSEEELRTLVAKTLKSYAKNFHNCEIEVQLATELVTTPKTVKLEQKSTFRAAFGLGNSLGDCVPA